MRRRRRKSRGLMLDPNILYTTDSYLLVFHGFRANPVGGNVATGFCGLAGKAM